MEPARFRPRFRPLLRWAWLSHQHRHALLLLLLLAVAAFRDPLPQRAVNPESRNLLTRQPTLGPWLTVSSSSTFSRLPGSRRSTCAHLADQLHSAAYQDTLGTTHPAAAYTIAVEPVPKRHDLR